MLCQCARRRQKRWSRTSAPKDATYADLNFLNVPGFAQSSVTAVTVRQVRMGDTPVVNMVRGHVRRPSLSRETRGGSGKGKPRLASFIQGSPVAAHYRPPVSATGPRQLILCNASASEAKSSFGGDFFARSGLHGQLAGIIPTFTLPSQAYAFAANASYAGVIKEGPAALHRSPATCLRAG